MAKDFLFTVYLPNGILSRILGGHHASSEIGRMPRKKIITTKLAPAAKGPYSQGVVAGDFIFVAGQGPVAPKSGRFCLGDIRSECELTLKNIEAILKAAGTTLENVVQCTVYLRDLADFNAMNEVYSRFFPKHCPTRTTIQAANLLHGIKVEIDAVALLPDESHALSFRRHGLPRRSRK